LNLGVSDREESLNLTVSMHGHRGGNSFLKDGQNKVEVKCRPLLAFVEAEGIKNIKALKIDIEGFEFRVLNKFFSEANTGLWPEAVILEYVPSRTAKAGGESLRLLLESGYVVHSRHGINYILTRRH